jgi:spore coat polysaccharide biosynthesis protein SpsF
MIKIILQARMGASRLPGKMLKPIIDGKGALELMIERLKKLSFKHSLLVATTQLEEDNVLEEICKKLNVASFRGHSTDVLDRYYNAANLGDDQPEIVVRLTGDCPLHDVDVIEQVVDYFIQNNVDYVSNTNPPTYPDGLDVEVMSYKALASAFKHAKKEIEREHVTPYIRENKATFKCLNVVGKYDLSYHRWTLDEPEDFEFIKKIYACLYLKNRHFNMVDILQLLEQQPELLKINNHLIRNASYFKQIKESK